MSDILGGVPLSDFSAPALLGFAVVLLLTGRIVPKVHIDQRIKDAEQWRAAYEAERDARAASEAQTRELLEVAKTTHAVLVALFNTTSKKRGDTDAEKDDPQGLV